MTNLRLQRLGLWLSSLVVILNIGSGKILAQPLTGGSFVLVGTPAAGGSMSGGTLRLNGYVASAGAETSTASSYELTCGLLGIYVSTSGNLALQAELLQTGEARIWWASGKPGYVLESTTVLGPHADWQLVDPFPGVNEFVTSPGKPTRFFRLRRL